MDLSGLKMPLVTVYECPADFPGFYAARVWEGMKPSPTDAVVVKKTLQEIREDIEAAGFRICFPRADGDDPCIVETWMQ